MHGVYDLTWLGLFFGGCSCRKKEELLYLYFSTYNGRSDRAGLQSDFFIFIYVLPRALISSCVQ